MTIRTDVSFNMSLSPRLITVAEPSVEITIQDLHDTIVSFEDSIEGNQFPRLILSAGKEDLGGGVSVGISSTLQNAQLAFEPRFAAVTTGTVTTQDIEGTTCIAGSETYQSDGVEPGYFVHNHLDGSHASVLRIDSEIQLTTTALGGGSDNNYDIGDTIIITEVIQCNISGGNLVAIDDVGATIDPVFPSYGTQIVRTSSSSATLQELEDIQHASFQNGIWIDQVSGVDGTGDTAGNQANPVKTISFALTRLADKSFRRLYAIGDLLIGASDNVDGLDIRGESVLQTEITFTSGCSTETTEVRDSELTGAADGAMIIRDCHIEDLSGVGSSLTETNIHSTVFEPVVGPTLTLTAGATKNVNIINCESESPGNVPVEISFNGTGSNMTVRRWAGGFKALDATNDQDVSFDSTGGHLTLDSTCTDLNITVRGSTRITDNSAGGATVTDQTTSANNWINPKALTIAKYIGLKLGLKDG